MLWENYSINLLGNCFITLVRDNIQCEMLNILSEVLSEYEVTYLLRKIRKFEELGNGCCLQCLWALLL